MDERFRSRNRALAVGSELGVATIIGLFGGSWIDDRCDTSPLFTILGLVIGVAAGIKSLMRFAPKPSAPKPSAPKPSAPKPSKPDDSASKTDSSR